MLVDRNGTLYILDGGFESSGERICSFNYPLRVHATTNGSLIMINNEKISIRRDYRGVYAIKTAFDFVEDGKAKLELSLDEVVFLYNESFTKKIEGNRMVDLLFYNTT